MKEIELINRFKQYLARLGFREENLIEGSTVLNEKGGIVRPDLVIEINGTIVAVFEFKNMFSSSADVIQQLGRYSFIAPCFLIRPDDIDPKGFQIFAKDGNGLKQINELTKERIINLIEESSNAKKPFKICILWYLLPIATLAYLIVGIIPCSIIELSNVAIGAMALTAILFLVPTIISHPEIFTKERIEFSTLLLKMFL